MPPNILDGMDLKRGERFEEICQRLFPGVTNVEIGRILAGFSKDDVAAKGYSEGSIRRWKAGGPIGATALLALQRRGITLEYILEGRESEENDESTVVIDNTEVPAQSTTLSALAFELTDMQADLFRLYSFVRRGEFAEQEFRQLLSVTSEALSNELEKIAKRQTASHRGTGSVS